MTMSLQAASPGLQMKQGRLETEGAWEPLGLRRECRDPWPFPRAARVDPKQLSIGHEPGSFASGYSYAGSSCAGLGEITHKPLDKSVEKPINTWCVWRHDYVGHLSVIDFDLSEDAANELVTLYESRRRRDFHWASETADRR